MGESGIGIRLDIITMKPILLAFAVVTAVGCGKEESPLCAGTACLDSGFADSLADSVRPDVAVDLPDTHVAPADTASDIGDVAVGEWDKLIDEANCKVSYAFRPKEPIGLQWLPCKSGRIDCEVVDTSYTVSANKQQGLFPRHREPSSWHAGKLTVQLSKGIDPWTAPARYETLLMDAESGAVRFAIREQGICGALVSPRANLFALNILGPLEESRLVPSVVFDSFAKLAFQRVKGSHSATTRGENDILLTSGSGFGVFTNEAILPETKGCGSIESETHLVGDVFLGTREIAGVLSLVEVKCPSTVAVDAPNTGKTLIGYAVDRTESTLAWVEGTRDATGKIINKELWAAPILATTVDRDKKRKVANVSSVMSYMAAGFGRVLLAADTTKAQLVRLSDGRILEFDAESDFWFSRPLVVEKDRIWLSTGGADSRGPFFSGAVRMKYEFK